MLKETLVQFIAWKWNISEASVMKHQENLWELAETVFDPRIKPDSALGLSDADFEMVKLTFDLEEFFALSIYDDEYQDLNSIDEFLSLINSKVPFYLLKEDPENFYDRYEYQRKIAQIFLIDLEKYDSEIQTFSEYVEQRSFYPMKFRDYILTEVLKIDVNDPSLNRISPTKIEFTENETLFTVEIEDIHKEKSFDNVTLVFYEGKINDEKYQITNKHGHNAKRIIDKLWSSVVILVEDYMPLSILLSTHDKSRVNIYQQNINRLLTKELKNYTLHSSSSSNNGTQAKWFLKRRDH